MRREGYIKNMKKQFEKLSEIYEVETEIFRGNTITYIKRKDNNRVIDLYDIFLDTVKIIEEDYELIEKF